MNEFETKLAAFVALLQSEQLRGLVDRETDCEANRTHYCTMSIPGRKFTKVDVYRGSGRFMVENATGIIYGIKGYGQVHKGHVYGTLDTIGQWDWSGYYPHRKLNS